MDDLNAMSGIGSSSHQLESLNQGKEITQATATSLKKEVSENELLYQQGNALTANASTVEASAVELDNVITEINHVMEMVQKDINFSIDEHSGRKVISIYEKGSGTLIRQLPSEEALKLLSNLEQLKGIIFKADV